jgi:hydrogenase expression/formation protein HypC
MCLAIPGKITAIDRETTPVMGDVNFSGITRRVCLEWVPEVRTGDYVIVHVGFAISRLDEEEALETLRMLEEMGDLAQGTGEEDSPPEPGPR